MASLLPLVKIINDRVATLQDIEQRTNTLVPSLGDLYDPQSEAFRKDDSAAEAAIHIVAAALQLAATLAPPFDTLLDMSAGGLNKAAALQVCSRSHVTEILSEAGPQGLHVEQIALKNGLNHKKLVRFLRFLASHHIYEEVKPNIFRNNRLSSLLDTGKPSADLIARPDTKYDGAKGVSAFIELQSTPEISRAATYIWDNVSDPRTRHSEEPNQCPVSTYLGRDIGFYDYYAEPAQQQQQKHFDLAMKNIGSGISPQVTLEALPWSTLNPGSVVVDVGGGIGTFTLPLVRTHPNIRLVIQDLPATLANAHEFWAAEYSQAIGTGAVVFEAHNFFDPQPKRNVDVFFVKSVLHNWSDTYAHKILGNLRRAAIASTRLVIIDGFIPYACREDEHGVNGNIAGHVPQISQVPSPLLPCAGSSATFNFDLVMFKLFGSQERTVDHLRELLLKAGWRLDEVRRPLSAGMVYLIYEASPI